MVLKVATEQVARAVATAGVVGASVAAVAMVEAVAMPRTKLPVVKGTGATTAVNMTCVIPI